MKVIQDGEPSVPVSPDWVGRVVTCPHCQVKVELEAGDADLVHCSIERHPGGKRSASVTCITEGCQGTMVASWT